MGPPVDATTTTERTTASSRPRNTSTTPPVRSFEPTIPLAPGLRLLGWISSGWGEVLDPATGLVTPTRLAAETFEIYPSDIAERVWIGRWAETASFAEVDLATGEELGPATRPGGAYPAGAVDGGLVVQAPDGLDLFRRGADRFEWIVNGQHVASSGHWLAYRSCDELLRCPISVRDLDEGTDTEMEISSGEISEFFSFSFDARLSPDGRWLAVASEQGRRVDVFDVATSRSMSVSRGPSRMTGFAQVVWTPEAAWLLWPEPPAAG